MSRDRDRGPTQQIDHMIIAGCSVFSALSVATWKMG